MNSNQNDNFFNEKKRDIYKMLNHCQQNVTHYKIHWHFVMPTYEDFSYDFFKKIVPILEKNEVRDAGEDLISMTVDRRKLVVETTSGSEAKPIKCYKSQNEKLRCSMDLWNFRKQILPTLSPKDKFVHFYVARRQQGKFVTSSIIYENNILHLSLFDLSLDTLIDYWDEILKFKPRWIHGGVSTLYCLACVIKEHNLPRYHFDLIELTGEFLDNEKKKIIEEVFNCRIANQYGAREFWTIAYGCYNSTLHLNDQSVFVEEVYDEGTKTSELLVTSLKNYSWPLIRYKIGDCGKIKANDCNCGNQLSYTLELKRGRVSEVCQLGNAKLSRTLFSYIVRNINEAAGFLIIKQYQIIKVSNMKIEIKLVGLEDYNEKIHETFLAELKKYVDDVQIKVIFVDYIPPDNNTGKVKEFMCLGGEENERTI